MGSEGETLPDHVGMPLGEKYGGADYFMLETHYDNPDVHQNIIDASGLQIYYTKNLREHDTAMLLLGSEVNFLHMIPPQQEMYKTIGRCTAECTQNVRLSFTVFFKEGKTNRLFFYSTEYSRKRNSNSKWSFAFAFIRSTNSTAAYPPRSRITNCAGRQ